MTTSKTQRMQLTKDNGESRDDAHFTRKEAVKRNTDSNQVQPASAHIANHSPADRACGNHSITNIVCMLTPAITIAEHFI